MTSFKVAALSSNLNSFGLRNHIMVARDGRAVTGAANHLNQKNVGDVVDLNNNDLLGSLTRLGFEIPDRLDPDAPAAVVQEIWERF